MYNLPPPSLLYKNLFEFYQVFIERFVDDSKKGYSYSQTGINKE